MQYAAGVGLPNEIFINNTTKKLSPYYLTLVMLTGVAVCGVLARCAVASFNPQGSFAIVFIYSLDEDTNMLIRFVNGPEVSKLVGGKGV